MAYSCPRDLDGFLPHLTKPDTRFRQQVGADLLAFLADPTNLIVCQDIGQLIDSLIPWMQSSNFKVSSNGIEIITNLIDKLGSDFRPYLQSVLPNVIDRLGDAKDTVREKAQLLILKLLERSVLSPQILLEKLSPGFSHKNAKIREEVLRCLINILNEHGAQSLTLSKFIPDIVKLLSDPTSPVRDTAFLTLVELYKHIGEKLRNDLQRRNLVPQTKWPTLNARFDEVKSGGGLMPTASKSMEFNMDEVDKIPMAKPTLPKKPTLGSAIKQKMAPSSAASSNGAIDEETFIRSFEEVPTLQIFSGRDVSDHFKNIQDTISDPNKDWSKRQDALKKIRSLVIAEATNFEEFFICLKQLEIPLQVTIRDLRSQIIREACITISYLTQILGNKYDKSIEFLLPALINLIQNSAKVVATAGLVTIRFIIQNTYNSRLIPIFVSNATTSKSKEIRRSCFEFIEYVLTQWPGQSLERHVGIFQEALKKGVADADPEARGSSRRAFRGFHEHFPDQAEHLLQNLEPSYRRALQGEQMSGSSSNNNLNSVTRTARQYVRPMGLQSATDSGKRGGYRSNSAIDLQAAQRAKARAQYAQMARNKVACGTASLPRPRKPSDGGIVQSPERLGRNRSRSSQSTPTSRSASPSSRLAYLHRGTEYESPRIRRTSGIPRSTQGSRDTSRETSPNRSTLGRYRTRNDRPPPSPASRPVLAQKILQQSREAENALADAFLNDSTDSYRSPRKNISIRSIDNHSDESETSSICSDMSFDLSRRTYDDINEIMNLCASTIWQERKDGLLSLKYYITSNYVLMPKELKTLTDIFTKMFMDSHTKALSMFLDTLHEVIKVYKNELQFWVYVLLQRVFLKLGSDILNSVQSKLLSTLEIIKQSFSGTVLLTNVFRFLGDATQTPSSKVKIVVLNFMTSLINGMDSQQFAAVPLQPAVLQKILLFVQDTKSVELRTSAKLCLLAFWNCDTPKITIMLGELPKDQSNLAMTVVHNHMRRNSNDSEPGSPVVLTSPKPMSPGFPRTGLDRDEIYKNLRKTTAEIQNYSYETLSSKLERDRDTTSQDSGISQMSIGTTDIRNDIALTEERLDALSISSKSRSRSLPYQNANGVQADSNGFRSLDISKTPSDEVVKSILEQCVVDNPIDIDKKRNLLLKMVDIVKKGDLTGVKTNFKKILRILIDNLNEKDFQTQIYVLEILTAIFQNKELEECWSNFVELLTLRVLDAHSDENREVVKAAEVTAAAMAVCPFSTVASTLAPLIATTPYPTLLGAIKMLTKLIEIHPTEINDEFLNIIMPGLIKATDHNESPVRKSSIFCMIAIHKAVGSDRMEVFVSRLSGSKQKLLRLYISRAEQNTSMSSPKAVLSS